MKVDVETSPEILAQFAGRCSQCRGAIRKGDPIKEVLAISSDLSRLHRQFAEMQWAVGITGIKMSAVLSGLSELEVGRRELALARKLQSDDPHWNVQCITTHEGRCRVVVKYLGGWS